MNKDNGPIPTSPLWVLINKDSYGSVNRGNKIGINSAKSKFTYVRRRCHTADLLYNDQKCTVQPVGINTLAKVPSKVASSLDLPDTKTYSGHCIKRTSISLLVNKGADIAKIKQHGRWESSSVAQRYIDESISNKPDTAKQWRCVIFQLAIS
ncbi:hypothetical protein NQ318_007099 [Aromia moschata]|uniref:Tyr recombinase domain-containing protein n=1 Tax=Aromia moschata TaxID=1265417 RepID=A0AAV8XUV1_9CUCU|nr:hypothetical protein NQ318_007099 [Aromia moschata]